MCVSSADALDVTQDFNCRDLSVVSFAHLTVMHIRDVVLKRSGEIPDTGTKTVTVLERNLCPLFFLF